MYFYLQMFTFCLLHSTLRCETKYTYVNTGKNLFLRVEGKSNLLGIKVK